jgi:hypothetical protein
MSVKILAGVAMLVLADVAGPTTCCGPNNSHHERNFSFTADLAVSHCGANCGASGKYHVDWYTPACTGTPIKSDISTTLTLASGAIAVSSATTNVASGGPPPPPAACATVFFDKDGDGVISTGDAVTTSASTLTGSFAGTLEADLSGVQ